MADHHRCHPLLSRQVPEELNGLHLVAYIQIGGGLVQKQIPRRLCDPFSDADLLTLSGGNSLNLRIANSLIPIMFRTL